MAITRSSGCCARGAGDEPVGRPLEPEIFAQRRALVFGAEPAALLQDRHHLLDEVGEPGRQDRRHDVEAVGRAVVEPLADRVGHLLGRPDHRAVAARRGQRQIELAQRQAARGEVRHQLQPALVELGIGRQRRRLVVERIAREVDARHSTA